MTIARTLSRLAALLAMLAAAAAFAQQTASPRLDTRLSAPPRSVLGVDRIVAVVNDDVITQLELAERLRAVMQQLRRGGGQVPPQNTLQAQILERLINELVQTQMAKDTGLRVDDATVDKAVQRIADDNSLSMSAFRAALERDGIAYNRFREEMRKEIMLTRLREREVENAIVVTDAEVETELARAAKQRVDMEYRLQHVLVLIPQQATPEQIENRRRRAMQALAEIRQGTAFPQVAATFSDAPDALQGGDLGWRPAGRLPTIFLEAIERTKTGEVTDILRSPNGFHIVKVLETRGKDSTPTVTQTRARHILIRTKEGVSDSDVRNRLLQVRSRIAAGEEFGELARVTSEDGTAAKGGDLGWLSPGDTVPEFERAMAALKVGEMSQPVQSPFGWHLVQVLERRTEEISEERRKQAARQTIRARKGDDAYQDWVRQMRDRAFVEIRLDER